VLTKFPLVAGLFALVFAVGSLFGIRGLGAGISAFGGEVAPRLTDFLFWVGILSSSLVVLVLYGWLLQMLGIVEAPSGQQPQKEDQTQGSLPGDSGPQANHAEQRSKSP
jgi:hypothetical protein